MSEYQVIARKWRPQTFADVVGQEHLTRTLKNAIVQNRTAHAYLLVGPRGIGKTTTARILAKALNCTNSQDGEPCCQCESCRAIAADNSLDVIEIDAASQNSVDNVRTLCEQVTFAPVNSRYRIYIVDEVHMLSKSAWNAFLKTLEEPPPHVKFIFATTEVHKILPTILSRCQRFDLRRIPTALIADRLHKICTAENIQISKEALESIARAADGGMRDAQSRLDQVITFYSADKNKTISEEEIFTLFGITAPRDMDALLDALLHGARDNVIRSICKLARDGKNLETLLDELLSLLRAVFIALTLDDAADILESDTETVERYRALGVNVPPERIRILMDQLTGAAYGLRNALNKQVFLETALLRAMREAHAVRIDDILAGLAELKKSGSLKALEAIAFDPFTVRAPTIESASVKEIQTTPAAPSVPSKKHIPLTVEPEAPIPVETWPYRSPNPVVEAVSEPKNEPAPTVEEPVEVAPEPDVEDIPEFEPEVEPAQETAYEPEVEPEHTVYGEEESVTPPYDDDEMHLLRHNALQQQVAENPFIKKIQRDFSATIVDFYE